MRFPHRPRVVTVAAAAVAAALALRCNGTETDNPAGPLASFQGTACDHQGNWKDAMPATNEPASFTGTRPGSASLALDQSEDLSGLECLAWKRLRDGLLRVDLSNVPYGCGAEWSRGTALLDGTSLRLEAVNPGCTIASCGWCIYDFEFDVRDVPEGTDLDLHFAFTDTDGSACQSGHDDVLYTLPTAATASGTVCKPLSDGNPLAPLRGCVRHSSCDLPSAEQPCTCPESDVCAPIVEGGEKRCLAPCATDADCPNSAMGCVEGGCRIESTW